MNTRPPSRRALFIVRLIVAATNVYRRLLAAVLGIVGPRIAYAMMAAPARLLYRVFDPIRQASEAQCRAALAGNVPNSDIHRIAEQGFIHRIWNLTDLMLADRLLHPGTFDRYGGRVREDYLSLMQTARRQARPVILLTAYYGSFDLLPIFLGYNDLPAGVVYRPNDNAAYDAYRLRIRSRGGCEMIPVESAADRLPRILTDGGTVAIVADHHADKAGEPVTFLGLPTRAIRSVGLLAWRYDAFVVVAGIRRIDNAFRFNLIVEDLFGPDDWKNEPDAVVYILNRYLRGLERLILADPSQYLWAHPRWGTDFLQQLLDREGRPIPPERAIPISRSPGQT